MPKRVDREQRRAQIVSTYLTIAAREGIDAATTRAVAAELGVATGALWHYFSGFDEVLHEALKQVFHRTNDRIAARLEGLSGLRALTEMLQEIIPTAPVTESEAYVVVSFWGRVPSHPDMAEIQSVIVSHWHNELHRLLTQAVRDEELTPEAPLGVISDTILALSMGAQLEYVLRTPLAQPHRQWQMVHHTLAPWMTESGHAAGRFRELIGSLPR
ncbi:TetR/AcrR family transcriptional regulator [Nesterenkonia natronophila]|uniref:TetR/AcrR family transcriptional regulator n=1 Tax=Nesterenkonia natronophila TaxID=2174932 RepID=A0A3A4F4F2_9MICC|nr:TetR family transcriptional regulator C-terminal domain-containing protein [Nesterenkonia natronophila]RJN32748.1 TetR/AcrR family transcriptional regulator [Nesterenkonia natronophila]